MTLQASPERALVGDCILKPGLVPEIRRRVSSGKMFVDEAAGKIFDVCLAVFDAYGDIDAAMMSDRCKALGLHPSAWLEYSECGSPAMWENHAGVVLERYAVRDVVPQLQDLAGRLALNEVNVLQSVELAMHTLQNVKDAFIRETVKTSTEIALELSEKLENIFSGKGSGAVPFGLEDIDRVTGGMMPGDLIVPAAKEKSGKSTLMIQAVYGNAEKSAIPSLIFSLEMKAWQIKLRKACIDCDFRVIDVLNNRLSPDERRKLSTRVAQLSRLPVFIRDNPVTIADIQADTERLVREKGIKLVCVDYIQRVIPRATKGENREREVAAISSGLKSLALELDVPIVALSQVNEDFRARESRAIEQDMDKMILIGERPELRDGEHGLVVPIQIRQRLGLSTEMGDVSLYYNLRHGTWHSSYLASASLPVPTREPHSYPISSEHDTEGEL